MRSIRIIQSLIVALASTMMLLLTSSVVLADAKHRPLHVTKDCPGDETGAPGGSCTITASNLELLDGAQVLYGQKPYNKDDSDTTADPNFLDSNVVLDAVTGDRAVGRCTLDFQTFLGLCTFSDGTGKLAGFEARVDVSLVACDMTQASASSAGTERTGSVRSPTDRRIHPQPSSP